MNCHEVGHGQVLEFLDSTYPLILETQQKTRESIPVLGVDDFYQSWISNPCARVSGGDLRSRLLALLAQHGPLDRAPVRVPASRSLWSRID